MSEADDFVAGLLFWIGFSLMIIAAIMNFGTDFMPSAFDVFNLGFILILLWALYKTNERVKELKRAFGGNK